MTHLNRIESTQREEATQSGHLERIAVVLLDVSCSLGVEIIRYATL